MGVSFLERQPMNYDPRREEESTASIIKLKAQPTRLTGLHLIMSRSLIFTATAARRAKRPCSTLPRRLSIIFFPSGKIIDIENDNNQ